MDYILREVSLSPVVGVDMVVGLNRVEGPDIARNLRNVIHRRTCGGGSRYQKCPLAEGAAPHLGLTRFARNNCGRRDRVMLRGEGTN